MRGVLALVAGACLAALLIRVLILRHLPDLWRVARDLLLASWSVYFIQLGLRSVRYGDSLEKPATKLGWGRMLLGVQLIFLVAQVYFNPTPNLPQPSNEVQAVGFNGAAIAISVGGLALLMRGIRNRT